MAELEWLSTFVDDSLSTEEEFKTAHLLRGNTAVTADKAAVIPQTSESSSSCETLPNVPAPFLPETPFPVKARSKRSRAAPGDWYSPLLHLVNPASTPKAEAVTMNAKPARPETTPVRKSENSNSPVGSGRKCLHCAAEKTPQWRTGPMGPKTLCNACGVRYKSGRLVPEYRPAASPTFVSAKHSNSHRKVIELRRQKELLNQQDEPRRQHFLHPTSIFGASNVGDGCLIHPNSGTDYSHMF